MSDTALNNPSRFRRFLYGMRFPFRGAKFLFFRPRLWKFLIVPMMILAALLSLAASVTFTLTTLVMSWVWAYPEGALYQMLWLVTAMVAGSGIFALSALVLWVFSGLISTPFYDMMAEKIEAEVVNRPEDEFIFMVVIRDAGRSIRHSLLGLCIYLPLTVFIFVFGLIPVVGAVLGPVFGFASTSTFLARDILDMPLSRRRLTFKQKVTFLREHLSLFEGLGFSTAILMAVPLLNLLIMPAAIAGATLLYCELELNGQGVKAREALPFDVLRNEPDGEPTAPSEESHAQLAHEE